MTLPVADSNASPPAALGAAERMTRGHPAIVVDANTANFDRADKSAPNVAPPHLLWVSLESAFATPEKDSQFSRERTADDDQRLPPYIAFPIAMGVSLAMWVGIVELVLRR